MADDDFCEAREDLVTLLGVEPCDAPSSRSTASTEPSVSRIWTFGDEVPETVVAAVIPLVDEFVGLTSDVFDVSQRLRSVGFPEGPCAFSSTSLLEPQHPIPSLASVRLCSLQPYSSKLPKMKAHTEGIILFIADSYMIEFFASVRSQTDGEGPDLEVNDVLKKTKNLFLSSSYPDMLH
jgi:hypothetical protein